MSVRQIISKELPTEYAGNSNIINTYSREDIGITLKVKPRLSSNNKVSLEVETKIEDIEQGSGASTDRPNQIQEDGKGQMLS